MTCGELRRHLDQVHGHPTTGWAWQDLLALHTEFHEATAPAHQHEDPDQ